MSTPENVIVKYALCDVPITRGTFTWDKYRGTLFINKEGIGGEDSFRNSGTTVQAGDMMQAKIYSSPSAEAWLDIEHATSSHIGCLVTMGGTYEPGHTLLSGCPWATWCGHLSMDRIEDVLPVVHKPGTKIACEGSLAMVEIHIHRGVLAGEGHIADSPYSVIKISWHKNFANGIL